MRPTPRTALLALALLAPLAPPAALAQSPAAAVAADETLLRLTETGEVKRAPDELRLDLRAEARGTDAATCAAEDRGAAETVRRCATASCRSADRAQGTLVDPVRRTPG